MVIKHSRPITFVAMLAIIFPGRITIYNFILTCVIRSPHNNQQQQRVALWPVPACLPACKKLLAQGCWPLHRFFPASPVEKKFAALLSPSESQYMCLLLWFTHVYLQKITCCIFFLALTALLFISAWWFPTRNRLEVGLERSHRNRNEFPQICKRPAHEANTNWN